MKDDRHLQQQLSRPTPPPELEAKIISNWQEQLKRQRRSGYGKRLLVAASLCAIALGAGLFVLTPEPDLVQFAIADIKKDAAHNHGIILPVSHAIKQAKINMPPADMPVKLSKRCELDGNNTVHLKVAGAQKGAVHLFIKKGSFDVLPNSDKATMMPWKLITPRKDLSVLVLYTSDMNPANVDKLLDTMFYT